MKKTEKKFYEIHKDINIKGKSGETHEADVAVLTSKEARKARDRNIDPQGGSISKLVGYFECKFYSKDLPKEIAREYIGLVKELNNRAVNSVVSNLSLSQMEKAKRILNKHELSIFIWFSPSHHSDNF